jgi:hypothetical protein
MRIERRTDNLPIHNPHFPANWELYLPGRQTREAFGSVHSLSAAGNGEFHPVAQSTSTVILNPISSITDTTTVKFAPSHLFSTSFCAKTGFFTQTTVRSLIAYLRPLTGFLDTNASLRHTSFIPFL